MNGFCAKTWRALNDSYAACVQTVLACLMKQRRSETFEHIQQDAEDSQCKHLAGLRQTLAPHEVGLAVQRTCHTERCAICCYARRKQYPAFSHQLVAG